MKNTKTKTKSPQKTTLTIGIVAMVFVGLALVGFIISLGVIFNWFHDEESLLPIFATGFLAVIAALLFIVMGSLAIAKVDYFGNIKGKVAGIVILSLVGAAILSFVIGIFMPIKGNYDLLEGVLGSIIGAFLLASTAFTIVLMVKSKKNKKS